MKTIKKKIAIIGAGSAGMYAYREVMKHTGDIVLIESDRYGTMCARAGCMPSKLLITASDHAHRVNSMDRFGINVGPVSIDGVTVMKRVREMRDDFVAVVVDTVESWPPGNRLIGHAKFLSPGRLQVGDDTIVEAERIVIATGSQPNIPAGWRESLGDQLIVNDDIFQWQSLPESVLVIGSGAIGLELAQSLSRLGVRVQVLSRSHRLGPLTDPVVLDAAVALIKSELQLSDGVEDISLHLANGRVAASWSDGAGSHHGSFDYVLAALGRSPDLAGLDLTAAGLQLDEKVRPIVNRATSQIGDAPVFLAGDAQGARALLHEAADDGLIAGSNAVSWPRVQAHPRRTPLSIVFTDPQIAMVGASHSELTTAGILFAVGTLDWAEQGRANIAGENLGQLRIYGDKTTGKLLGAEMIGPRSEHLAHQLAWCIQMGLTASQLLSLPFYHPVFEEGVRSAVRSLLLDSQVGSADGQAGDRMGP